MLNFGLGAVPPYATAIIKIMPMFNIIYIAIRGGARVNH